MNKMNKRTIGRCVAMLLVFMMFFSIMPAVSLAEGVAPPAIPTSIHAASASYNSIQVSWDAVDGADGYSIYRATKSSGPYTYLCLVSDTGFIDEGLTTGQTHYYRVRSYIMDGNTRIYGTFAPAVAARPVPTAPTNFSITGKTYTTVSMTWDAVTGATGYRIYRKISGASKFTLAGDTTAPSYQNKGLKSGTTYTFKVAAYQTVGNTKIGGYQSNTASEQTLVASGIPTSIGASSKSYNSIEVCWDAVTGADGYSIYRATKSSGPYTYLRLVSGTNFIDPALTTGQHYYYRVRSYIMDGSARAYGTFAPAVAARPIPVVPANFSITDKTYTTVSMTWDAVSGATGYRIYRKISGASTFTLAGDTASLSYQNKGLKPGTAYTFKVAAYRTTDSTKIGGYQSNTASEQTLATSGIPTSIRASSSSYNSIQVSWNAVSGADGYSIYRATKSSGPYTYLCLASGTSFVDLDLTTGQTYYYRVRSYITDASARAYGTFAPAVAARTIPATPTSLSYSNGLPYTVSVGWGMVSGSTGYQLWYSTSENGTYTRATTTPNRTYRHTGLVGDQTYYYKVRAYSMVASKVVYGNFSAVLTASSRNPIAPNFTVCMGNTTMQNTYAVAMQVQNNGTKEIQFHYDGFLYDYNYNYYDRDLRLTNDKGVPISNKGISGGDSDYINFSIVGEPTWYDANSAIFYRFTYDTIMYVGASSYNFGTEYRVAE